MAKEHTSEEIKYRLSDLGKQIGNIAINYITKLENENAYAKTIIQDLLDNSDEYARQRAIDFLKEE